MNGLQVEFYKLRKSASGEVTDDFIGSVGLGDDGKLYFLPESEQYQPFFDNLQKEPVVLPGGIEVSQADPEKWLSSLSGQYKGAYLRCGTPHGVTMEGLPLSTQGE